MELCKTCKKQKLQQKDNNKAREQCSNNQMFRI